MNEVSQEFKDYVAAGVALLDEKLPDWEDHIDIPRLDAASFHYCILGQLYGSYLRGEDVLFSGNDYSAGLHGFYPIDRDDWAPRGKAQTDYWKSIVVQKREEKMK